MTVDWRAVVWAAVRMFVWWLIMVLLVTWRGYPGVVCCTPMAWLLALPVGNLAASGSASAEKAQRLREAALAGGVLGLLQGVLFAVLLLRAEIRPSEVTEAVEVIAAGVVLGLLICPLLSLFTASLWERRRAAP